MIKLYEATYHKDLATVKSLVAKGEKITREIFLTAVNENLHDIVEFFTTRAVTPRALAFAAGKCDLKMVKILYKHDSSYLNVALNNASAAGRLDIMSFLLDKGAKIDRSLIAATHSGTYSAAKLLLERGASMCMSDHLAFRNSAAAGDTPLTALFLEYGADVHALEDNAIRVATRYGRVETMELLMEHGADISVKDYYIVKECQPKLLPILLKHLSKVTQLELKMRGII